MTTTILTRALAAAAVGALALTAVPAATAHADGTVLAVTYDAAGTSVVKKTGSTIALGPTTLAVKVAPDGSLTGSLPLPPRTTTFKVLGLLPVTATVTFVPAGGKRQVTGTLGVNKVRSKARYVLRLSDVSVGGLPAFVGSSCQTSSTVVIPANTPAGQKFDITTGGTLEGTYTIPSFANCGLTTGIINLLVPGEGNTETITLSNGRLG